MIWTWILIFIVSIYFLVKAADYFTDYSEKLGKILNLPNFIIGVLIVAIGTSIPELATSIMGVQAGEAEFLSGNVLGTVIINVLLGLGIAILVVKNKVKFNWDIVSNDLPFFAAAIFLVIISLSDGVFTTVEAVIFVIGFFVYIFYAYLAQKSFQEKVKARLDRQIKKEINEEVNSVKEHKHLSKDPISKLKVVLIILASLGVILLASYFVVESILQISSMLQVGTTVMAATAVALGTSLPEIVVAISAARRRNYDMMIGNILGSSIFDIFMIFGFVGMFTTLIITPVIYWIMIPFLVATFLLLWLTLIDKKITKTEAMMFILIFFMFIGKMFEVF
ncbi:sodium:calcium antiporter [Candidatus Falkowbacteria bacterium]|jgi:cation:H+ antiporter|nr:sodium:calcium antiporter [Candidatus Falkowbacteria bacterium]MBT7007163.1 sodium:calcium antiporter [Candidatus Falkowbacteria bacterium]